MSLLALVAMLLFLLVPTTGRLRHSDHHPSSDGAWAQLCTIAGLKLVKLAPVDADPLPPGPTGDGDMPMQVDCAYCPVLNAMAALLLCVVLAFPRLALRPWPSKAAEPTRRRWHPSGLGSRGPPIAL